MATTTKRRTRRKSVSAEQFEQMVRERAYELYETRGGLHGDALADWFQAEAELKEKYRIKK